MNKNNAMNITHTVTMSPIHCIAQSLTPNQRAVLQKILIVIFFFAQIDELWYIVKKKIIFLFFFF